MLIKDGERCDEVNDALSLIQKTDGLLFGTDALLLAAYINGKYKTAVELGGGTGIISMLLLSREKVGKCHTVEAQEEFADLIKRNAALNRLEDRLNVYHADVRDFKLSSECELVFTNPPYMKTDSGAKNTFDMKNAARHEVFGGIYDFLLASKRFLKFGGTFAAVYRPDRFCDLISAMRDADIGPKKLTFVHADTKSEPSMVLIIGKRGAKPSLVVTKPLIIYSDESHKEYGYDMDYIMENGSFPEEYNR